MNNRKENISAFIFLILSIIVGLIFSKDQKVFARYLVGIGLGYALIRSSYGFAGTVNRLYRAGSAKLMQSVMYFFVVLSIVMAGFMIFGEEDLKLNINPINLGLPIGAFLFGLGMALNSCCASGTITDSVPEFPKALITWVFFTFGVFIGFPIQKKWPIAKDSLLSTGDKNGVFFPDFFREDGLNGYLGAVIVTILLASLVAYLAKKIEEKKKREGRYSPLAPELAQKKAIRELSENDGLYYRLFRRPWTMKEGVLALTICIAILVAVAQRGWGVTSAMGHWFGHLLTIFGLDPGKLEAFTGVEAEKFTASVFESGGRAQNLGILLGTISMYLFSGSFLESFKEGFKVRPWQLVSYIFGGLSMGIGTRFAHGCNAGALLTPISQFSLSGWLFFIFMVIGGITGNLIRDKLIKSCER